MTPTPWERFRSAGSVLALCAVVGLSSCVDPDADLWVDAFTVFFLLFYLVILFHGAVVSTAYGLGYFGDAPYGYFGGLIWAFVTGGPDAAAEVLGHMERSPTAWRPYLWPIKIIMIFGFFLMLLQAISELLKDIATLRGVTL